MDKELLGLILGFIAFCGGVYYGGTWIMAGTYDGMEYDVTITVQAVEKSTRFWDHTNVWVQVYGDQDITYELCGFHDFEIGSTYNLKFKNKMVFSWYTGFNILGKVESTSVID